MRRLVLAVLAVLSLSVPARADFIKNFEEWKRLGPEGQAAYAMAIFDVMTVVTADNKYTAARGTSTIRKPAMPRPSSRSTAISSAAPAAPSSTRSARRWASPR